jgi:hypothetical protein
VAPVYSNLRDMVLTLEPGKAGIAPSAQAPNVWGVLMESGWPEGVSTLVALADGTTSLYFSGGGGLIGYGTQEVVAVASRALVARAEDCLGLLSPATTFPLPAAGHAAFHVLTFGPAFTAEVAEEELLSGRHPLTPLYFAAHEVIARMRLDQEKAK